MSEDPTPDQIMQVGLGFWASKTLLSAVEMELFTELARHPESGEALRDRLGLHSRSYQDFLDALVALGFLERGDGVYRNTPSTDLFLDKHKPSYIGGILEMANHRLYRFWGGLTEALRTGQLQNEAKSGETPFFQALYADPARLKGFLAAMTGLSHGANLAIARQFPWHEHETFVDVGTAQGDLALQMPEEGALIVYETIIDDDRSKNAFGLLMSLNMLIEWRMCPITSTSALGSSSAKKSPAANRSRSIWRRL